MKLFFLLLLFTSFFSYNLTSQTFTNKGAKISFNSAVKVKMIDIDFKNDNDGLITIKEQSEVRNEGGDYINESGTIIITESTIFQTTENLINRGIIFNDDLSRTIVFKNVINYSIINNESNIEIGE